MVNVFFRRPKYSYDNTRRFVRLPAAWPVRYEAQTGSENPGGERKVTHTADVSAGGIALSIREMLPVGSRVQVEVHIPPLDRSVHAMGIVMRCMPDRQRGYNVGIRFEQIDAQDQALLNDAIEQFYSPRQRNRHQGGAWWRRL